MICKAEEVVMNIFKGDLRELSRAHPKNLDCVLGALYNAELLRRKNQHRSDYIFPDGSALTVQHTGGRWTAWQWVTENRGVVGSSQWVMLVTKFAERSENDD